MNRLEATAGVIELPTAVRDGLVTLTGRREVLLRLPEALVLSPVAPHVRRARAASPNADPVRDLYR